MYIYDFRFHARNPGRKIRNLKEVIIFLKSRFTNVKVVLGPMNLHDSKTLFNKAKLIIGVHGGAMYNAIFAPEDTTIVEYLGVNENGEITGLAQTIIWRLAQNCGQTFYRIREKPYNSLGDIYMNISKLETVLGKIYEKN